MARIDGFFNVIEGIVSNVGSTVIKTEIGDSIENHRTLTVNQLVRFLTNSDNKATRNLGYRLREIYVAARVSNNIRRTPGRTDAVDINELIYSVKVRGSSKLRRTLSGLINEAI